MFDHLSFTQIKIRLNIRIFEIYWYDFYEWDNALYVKHYIYRNTTVPMLRQLGSATVKIRIWGSTSNQLLQMYFQGMRHLLSKLTHLKLRIVRYFFFHLNNRLPSFLSSCWYEGIYWRKNTQPKLKCYIYFSHITIVITIGKIITSILMTKQRSHFINSNKKTYRLHVSDFCSDQKFRL